VLNAADYSTDQELSLAKHSKIQVLEGLSQVIEHSALYRTLRPVMLRLRQQRIAGSSPRMLRLFLELYPRRMPSTMKTVAPGE
jgi:hypothetical protein